MAGRTPSPIRSSSWAIAWSLCHFRTAVGELTTSLLPRQTGYPGGFSWGQGPYPGAATWWRTCAGHTDYTGCPPPLGLGCCSQGLECQASGICVASSTTSTSSTVRCDQGWFSCSSSQGGGCCLEGQICGQGVCTASASMATTITGTAATIITSEAVSSQISPNLTSIITTIIAAAETVPQLSRSWPTTGTSGNNQESSQAAAASTGGSSAASQTGASSGGNSLTRAQIGGISAGAVVGFLLLVALGGLLVRHMIRISRFMDQFNSHPGDQPEKPITKGEEGTKDSELKILNDGNNSNSGNGQPLAELSPQERPQLLDEWGRHGSRGNELSGGQEAHGISELDGTSVSR